MKPADQNCGNCACRVHVTSPQDLRGQEECRALPPQMFAIPVQTAQGGMFAPASASPVVRPDHWCAMWRVGAPPEAALN